MSERKEWPLDVSPEKTLRQVIWNAGRVPPKGSRARTVPRWSAVGSATGHGSGYSFALCLWAGVDPDELVRPRR